jgi:hypothetical protein
LKPGIKVLFAARPETQEFTEGLGDFLPLPVAVADILAAVKRLLAMV